MNTKLGGCKRSHEMTRRIRERIARMRIRRNLEGRFESATDRVRREMAQRETIQELIAMPISSGPEVTAEGCAIEA